MLFRAKRKGERRSQEAESPLDCLRRDLYSRVLFSVVTGASCLLVAKVNRKSNSMRH